MSISYLSEHRIIQCQQLVIYVMSELVIDTYIFLQMNIVKRKAGECIRHKKDLRLVEGGAGEDPAHKQDMNKSKRKTGSR